MSVINFRVAVKVFDSLPLSGVIILDNVKFVRKILIKFSVISTKLCQVIPINIYWLGVFQYYFFTTLSAHAFKLLVKILLVEIFETVN